MLLTFGGLLPAMYWRVEAAQVSRLRAYYLYTGWAFDRLLHVHELRVYADPAIAGRGLARALVLGTPLATDAFALVDVIWMADPRLGELRTLAG
jgi:hypothetical protein